MTISGEDISRVTNLLKLRPRGMSIAAIAKELHLNRNSVAKYLDLLTASGAVEQTRVGPAKLYFTAPRVPVSGMINLSSDYFIMLDANLRVLYVNNNVLTFEGRTRPEVLQKKLDELSFVLTGGEEIQRYLHSTERDEIFQREVEVLTGEEIFHFRVKIISTVYENGTQGTTILLQDITTETEQRKAIQEREENLRAVMATAPAIILTVNGEGKILYANRAAGTYTAADVVGTSLFDYVPPDQQEILRHHLDLVFTTGRPTGYEVCGYGPEGPGTACYESHLGPVFQDGKMTAATLISLDVTDRRKAGEALHESEARYRAVVDSQQEGIIRFNPDGSFTFANDAFCRFVGRTPEQVMGLNVIHLIPDIDIGRIRETYHSLTPDHPSKILEFQANQLDGETRWIQADFRGFFDDHGVPVQYQAVARDVTELKAAERAIQESEARYRAVVEDQTEWIVRFSPDGIFTFANDAFCRYIGKNKEEVVGVPFTLPLSDQEYARTRETYRSLTPEHPHTSLEVQVTMPDGTIRFIDVTFRALFDERGNPAEYQAVGREVTARKKAEDLARAQFQSFPVPTYIWRKGGDDLVLSEFNDAALRITRGMITGHIGRTARDMFRERPAILANLERCLAEKTTIDDEMPYTFQSTGETRDLLVRCAYLPPDGVLVYTVDITDRKVAENQLRERITELRVLYDISRLIERDGRDLPALLPSIVQLIPAAFQYPDLAAARILYRGQEYATANFASTPWGIRREIHVNGVPEGAVEVWYRTHPPLAEEEVFLPEEEGLVGVVAERVGRIGEQIDAEAAVRDHVHLVTEILDRIPVPVYRVDSHRVIQSVNRAFEELAGLPREQIIGRTAAMLWPDEKIPNFDTATGEMLQTGKIHRDELVLRREGQDPGHMILHRAPFYGRDGAITGIVATIQNVTDLWEAEQALRASEEQFREMAETSPFPISIIDGDGRYRYVNRRFTELFGYTRDDVPTGRRWFDQAFPDPDLRQQAIAAWTGDLAGSRPGIVRPRQFPVQCRNGECREVIFRPVTLRDGTQYITYEDVTERLTTLDSLRQSESRFKHLFNSMRCCFTLVEPVLDEKGIPVDLTFREVNTAMERLSGRIREDLLGQQLREMYPNTPPELIEVIGRVALSGDPKKFAIYHPDFDRTLKIRAYSPWKGQCALIFRVMAPQETETPPGKVPPPGRTG